MQADYYGGLTSRGGLRQSEVGSVNENTRSYRKDNGAIFSALESIMQAGCEYHLDGAKLRMAYIPGTAKDSSLAPYNTCVRRRRPYQDKVCS